MQSKIVRVRTHENAICSDLSEEESLRKTRQVLSSFGAEFQLILQIISTPNGNISRINV